MAAAVDSEIRTVVIRETRIIKAVVVSETQTVVIKTTEEIRTVRTTKAAVDSEIQTVVIREVRILKAVVASEILEAQIQEDLNHQVADSETVPAAAKAQVQTDNRAVAALDRTIINNDYK